jgi:signal transduction histidine kinase
VGRTGDRALADRLRETNESVRGAMAGMRSLLVDLYPPSLRTGGLGPALVDLVGGLSGADLTVELDVDEEMAAGLPADVQEAVYRITQECLRNAAKHSGAQSVVVRLYEVDGLARLEIEDDGVGFDAGAALRDRPDGHLGLQLLADVAGRIGGTLSLRTFPGLGATYRLDVPYA